MGFTLIFLFLILITFFLKRKKFNRHLFNQKKAIKILRKLNSFEYAGQKINYLRKINPFVFEELLLTAFHNQGFKIKRNKKYTGDGGIDGIIYDDKGKKILIQAKRYKSYINNKHIKEFENLVISEKAFGGYFIHTGKSSEKSRNLYTNSNVQIIGGTKLLELINTKYK